ncbi:MAG: agmatinase [Methanosarcinales archaeon]|nr:agmatinase [Methanosarcinales archaeon]
MFQRCVFADAVVEADEAEYAILGLPFDSTASFRSGSRGGPDAVRQASYNFEPYDYRNQVDLLDVGICDLGNLDLGSDPALAWQAIRDSFSFIPHRAVPIFIGGEHSVTPPLVELMMRDGDVGVLVLDAHLDLRDEYGGTRMSHACASRRILDLSPPGYACMGIRSGSREEFDYAADLGLTCVTSDQVAEQGIDALLDRALELLGDRIYLSIDFDVLDPAYAPAVGNPEPFGLSPREVRRVVERVAPRAVALDVTEISPVHDQGQTALLGARLIRDFVAARARSRLPRALK